VFKSGTISLNIKSHIQHRHPRWRGRRARRSGAPFQRHLPIIVRALPRAHPGSIDQDPFDVTLGGVDERTPLRPQRAEVVPQLPPVLLPPLRVRGNAGRPVDNDRRDARSVRRDGVGGARPDTIVSPSSATVDAATASSGTSWSRRSATIGRARVLSTLAEPFAWCRCAAPRGCPSGGAGATRARRCGPGDRARRRAGVRDALLGVRKDASCPWRSHTPSHTLRSSAMCEPQDVTPPAALRHAPTSPHRRHGSGQHLASGSLTCVADRAAPAANRLSRPTGRQKQRFRMVLASFRRRFRARTAPGPGSPAGSGDHAPWPQEIENIRKQIGRRSLGPSARGSVSELAGARHACSEGVRALDCVTAEALASTP
jgi:hypothetical protein